MEQQKIEQLWGHLHWLTVLSQQGSFTAAADRLGVSKAAMSQRVAELERVAGVALVRRTTRSVRLTEAGQRLVDDTRASFEHIAQCFAQVRDAAGAPRGLLRVTAPDGVALSGTVTGLRYLGAGSRVTVALNGTEIAALLPAGQPVPETGSTVGLAFDPAALHVMEGP